MSDFTEILAFLGKLVVLLLELTFYVLAAALALAACCVPWRIPAIVWGFASTGGEELRDHFREICFVAFCMSLVDLVCLPLGLLAAAVRTCTLKYVECAVPLVAYDGGERERLTTNPMWLAAGQVLLELLFLPVALALSLDVPGAGPRWLCNLALPYYMVSALLASATWEAPVGREACLDIRTTGLFAGGHRLLLFASGVAALQKWWAASILLGASQCVWTLLLVCRGCSVPWVGGGGGGDLRVGSELQPLPGALTLGAGGDIGRLWSVVQRSHYRAPRASCP